MDTGHDYEARPPATYGRSQSHVCVRVCACGRGSRAADALSVTLQPASCAVPGGGDSTLKSPPPRCSVYLCIPFSPLGIPLYPCNTLYYCSIRVTILQWFDARYTRPLVEGWAERRLDESQQRLQQTEAELSSVDQSLQQTQAEIDSQRETRRHVRRHVCARTFESTCVQACVQDCVWAFAWTCVWTCV